MSDLIQKLKGKITELTSLCREQQDYIEALGNEPLVTGTIVLVEGAHVLVNTGSGNLMRFTKPSGAKVGSTVFALPDGQIVEVRDPLGVGPIVTARSKSQDGCVEINADGGIRTVFCDPNLPIKAGDRVVTDEHSLVVVNNLGQTEDTHQVSLNAGVMWSDIGGLDTAKDELRRAVEVPFQNVDLYEAYGKSPTKGVLLYGPPGCGKTMMAKAVVTALSNTHGEFHPSAFIYVKGAELLNKWVGETESQVRRLFSRARQHKEDYGYPAVIYIDEAEALLGRRGSREFGLTSTVVPMFLAEMDGLDDSSCIMLLSTNRPDALDPAVVRDGRIDVKVHVPRPDENTASAILKVHLKRKKLKASVTDIVNMVVEDVYSNERPLASRGNKGVPFRAILNGAMLKGIIEKACENALTRDIENGRKKPSGINLDDVRLALDKVHAQNEALDHTDALMEWEASLAARTLTALN